MIRTLRSIVAILAIELAFRIMLKDAQHRTARLTVANAMIAAVGASKEVYDAQSR